MPVEEFNGYISGQVANLGQDQIQLMKDIRRRGKNKVAAQNCRRRKVIIILSWAGTPLWMFLIEANVSLMREC